LLPQIQRLFTWSSELAQLLQLGEIWMASTQADLAPGMRTQGFPAAWVAPKEGAPMVNGGMSVIARAPFQDAALEYVNLYVSPEFQALRARHGGVVPTNTRAWSNLSAAERAGMPISPEDIKRLVRLNWTEINQNRAAWVERWHKEIQR
jgi:putative spermidine/putrescine transport system substrate-binding protein